MKISVQTSILLDSASAFEEARNLLQEDLGEEIDLLLVYSSSSHLNALPSMLQEAYPNVPVHGATTCRGLFSPEGHHSEDGNVLGLWGLSDSDGSYGVGLANFEMGVENAIDCALDQALLACDRPGEVPSLVWLASTPGNEEQVLQRLQDRLGEGVPVIGGSAADNNVEGHWAVFSTTGIKISDGVILCVMFPSVEIAFAFHSGYEPSAVTWEVTSASGRNLLELDGRPAAEVYDEASKGIVAKAMEPDGQSLLQSSTFMPLGRIDSQIGEIPMYLLSHPASVGENGDLGLFSEVCEGERLTLMKGSRDSLIHRPARVVEAAMEHQNLTADDIAGGIVIFCGGCMLAVEDDIQQIADEIQSSLPNAPFLGTFTFGEQGRFLNGANRHGNLMISCVLFKKS